jgi:hypothetical protein
LSRRVLHPPSQRIIHPRGEQKEEEKEIAGFVVKVNAHQKQVGISPGQTLVDQGKTNQNHGKVAPEKQARKVERSAGVKG